MLDCVVVCGQCGEVVYINDDHAICHKCGYVIVR